MGVGLSSLATRSQVPIWGDAALVAVFMLAGITIVLGLLLQVWVPAVQLRRFSRIFAGRPELVEAYNRVFEVYGWRARLACRLFRIPIPPGAVGARDDIPRDRH